MKKPSGLKYLILAMLAFAGLGLEVVLAFVLEHLLYHAPMQSAPKRNLLCKLRVEGSFSERCHLLPVTRIYRCKEQSGSCWKKKDAHREGGPYNEF